MRHSIVAVGLLLLSTSPASAQQTTPAGVSRDTVEVTLDAPDEELKGRLISFDDNLLSIEVGRRRIDLPMTRVVMIEKRVRDTPLDGALLMAAFLAACSRWWCEQGLSHPSERSPAAKTWSGALVGALIGGAIDAAIHRHEVIFQAAPPIATRGQRGMSVSYAVRF